jgi:hypothetical protein
MCKRAYIYWTCIEDDCEIVVTYAYGGRPLLYPCSKWRKGLYIFPGPRAPATCGRRVDISDLPIEEDELLSETRCTFHRDLYEQRSGRGGGRGDEIWPGKDDEKG